MQLPVDPSLKECAPVRERRPNGDAIDVSEDPHLPHPKVVTSSLGWSRRHCMHRLACPFDGLPAGSSQTLTPCMPSAHSHEALRRLARHYIGPAQRG
jgi:hypothetical protein